MYREWKAPLVLGDELRIGLFEMGLGRGNIFLQPGNDDLGRRVGVGDVYACEAGIPRISRICPSEALMMAAMAPLLALLINSPPLLNRLVPDLESEHPGCEQRVILRKSCGPQCSHLPDWIFFRYENALTVYNAGCVNWV